MAKNRTWLWIILGIFGVIGMSFVGCVGFGVYFFSQHFASTRATSETASAAFDKARAPFKDASPLLRIDSFDRVTPGVKRLDDLPTSATKPHDLYVLVFDQDKDQLVRLNMPFWLLKLGRRRMQFSAPNQDFDLQRLNLDINELERIGPALVVDYSTGRQRVLVWTQ
jgi:hypothetical protein